MKRFFILFIFAGIISSANAQVEDPVHWEFSSSQNNNYEAELVFTAEIEEGWHVYDTYLPEGGPIATSFNYNDTTLFELVGVLESNPEPEEVFDNSFLLTVRYYSNEVVFIQKIKLLTENQVEVNGYVNYMCCNDDVCLPPVDREFSFTFNEGKEVISEVPQSNLMGSGSSSGQSLWLFIIISFLAGLAAIVTPCVFPMIPMTVSFFIRGSDSRGKSLFTAFFFGISIVLIFTLLGALFSFGVFGPNAGNVLSTHWIPNLLFFILFFVFAISFFGAFEIILPGSLINKTDAKADKGGLIGAFFMALTTVIVSFSCTGPFIGALIIEAVQDGGLRPLFGMFFFGLAFATPFTLLAIFPSALKKLPKSGGWLNAIKVVFAFILLAFGLKFLSNIDQVYGFDLLNREIYLSIWIVIFFMLGLYFLGKIKLSHDSEISHLSTGRLILSIATFSFVLYLFTGLFGAPLTGISSLLPPATVHSSNNGYTSQVLSDEESELCGLAKYADRLHLPHGLQGYFDFEQGIACAEEQGKPAFVVFKGHACANCKKMENTVWADPETIELLSEYYVIIALYTDDRTNLPEDEWITSSLDGKVKKTMGKKNQDIQISKYNTNTIPYHIIIKPDGTEFELGVTFNNDEFKEFIKKGI